MKRHRASRWWRWTPAKGAEPGTKLPGHEGATEATEQNKEESRDGGTQQETSGSESISK